MGQQTARKLKVAMDELVLSSCFSESEGGSICISVTGLLLEGASFDRLGNRLVQQSSSSPLLTALPTLYMAWKTTNNRDNLGGTEARNPASQSGSVSVPVYVSLQRTKLLFAVQ